MAICFRPIANAPRDIGNDTEDLYVELIGAKPTSAHLHGEDIVKLKKSMVPEEGQQLRSSSDSRANPLASTNFDQHDKIVNFS